MIYRITGFLLLIETALLLCCAGVSLIYGEDDLNSFLLSAGLTTLVGILLLAVGKGAEKQLKRRICHCQCGMGRILPLRNAPVLP